MEKNMCINCTDRASFEILDGPFWKPICKAHRVIYGKPIYSRYNYRFREIIPNSMLV